jgi:hypothetical protein
VANLSHYHQKKKELPKIPEGSTTTPGPSTSPPRPITADFFDTSFGGLDLFDTDPDLLKEMDAIVSEERTYNPHSNISTVMSQIVKEARNLQKGKPKNLHIDSFTTAYTLQTTDDEQFFRNQSMILINLDDTMKDIEGFLDGYGKGVEQSVGEITIDGFQEILKMTGQTEEVEDDFNWDDF